MKNKKALILLIISLALIVAGLVAMNRQESACDGALTAGKSAVRAGNSSVVASDADLLDVGTPSGVASRIKDYEGFRVSFNKDNHTPNWVSWELLGSETEGTEARSDKFWTDSEMEGCPTTDDYRRSGFDRGHLCPAADQKWSADAMNDSFALTNIAPQDGKLNSGAWKTLEDKERLWARRDSAIVIVAGPIYEKVDTQRIGQTGVRVPSAFFKVIVAPYLAEPRGIAFVYPNTTAPGNMENYVMTIREVENLTGYDFFKALPDDVENSVETVSSFRDWNRRQ